ncbi:MAG: translation initiation factor 2 [Gammaproteobacteria bacterium]|nr:translation initiation factor 2 [Gammaproteobacteria bacterium]
MTEKNADARSGSEELQQQQLLRAISSFEGIMLSQIDIKNKLADRLNYSIRAGIIILAIIAVSILILLLTLSSQINRISSVVSEMNQDFAIVSQNMARISGHVNSMERQVANLQQINDQTKVMDREMLGIAENLEAIQGAVGEIGQHLIQVRGNVGNISVSMDRMDFEVLNMGLEMHRLGGSARSLNKMIPFP